ncbi:MAG: GNAT family N-acetyltransferase [Propionibacteriales bacterium]|nr:GNAT family N-acetyltransferase [Propionibacteriales bacterium]
MTTTSGLRLLGPADLPQVQDLLARDPVTNVFVDHRVRLTRLDPRWLGGEMWGYVEDGRLVSLCHAAANLVPVDATDAALDAFVTRALAKGRTCSSIVGRDAAVERIWSGVSRYWGSARLVRERQPFLVIDHPPAVPADPQVRRVRDEEFEILYPACVAMFKEEVGISPEIGGGRDLYRARIRQLIAKGLAFARIEDGRVVFKAEVGSSTPEACQVQGVWVHPARRGEGLSVGGMAAAVQLALADVAPVVTLYVNEHNVAARRTYDRVGFRPHCTFSTVLF